MTEENKNPHGNKPEEITPQEQKPENVEEETIPEEKPKLEDLKCVPQNDSNSSKKIFFVAGNDQKMNSEIEEFIKNMGLEPVLVRTKNNQSVPLAELVTQNKNVNLAIIILSADDFVYDKNNKPNTALTRANQKTVFDLGFWTGKLGRERVFAIYYDQKSFRTPTEFIDANYIPFYYKNDSWKNSLLNRIKNLGLEIDPSFFEKGEFHSMREEMRKASENQ